MITKLSMKEHWIIIPVFNRCALTKACLLRLAESGIIDRYTVCVVDDASTDGTREMLAEGFPSVIRVEGTGNLFWGGGVALGMQYAQKADAEVHIWLNDDCLVDDGSVDRIVERALETKGICGGVCFEEDGQTLAYSGDVIRDGKLQRVYPQKGERLPTELLNGNMVAIHRDVVKKLGGIDTKRFPHYAGDSIYGLEASRAGVAVEIDGSATGINPRGNYFERFGTSKPASAVWKDILWVGSPNYFPSYWHSLKAMFGWRAYYRWPAFYVRLTKLWWSSRKPQPQS